MVTTTNWATPFDELRDLYNTDQLKDIAHYGCISGAASYHITYQETNEFYDKWEDEILDYIETVWDDNPLKVFGAQCNDVSQLKNLLVWEFINSVAESITLESDD